LLKTYQSRLAKVSRLPPIFCSVLVALAAIRVHNQFAFGLNSACVQCDVGLGKERVCKAHHLADVSQELAMLIRARKKVKSDKENRNGADGDQGIPMDKARKIARMDKIRQIEGIPDTAPIVVSCAID